MLFNKTVLAFSKKRPQLFEPKNLDEFEKVKTKKLVVVVLPPLSINQQLKTGLERLLMSISMRVDDVTSVSVDLKKIPKFLQKYEKLTSSWNFYNSEMSPLFLIFRYGIGKIYTGAYDYISFLKYLNNQRYAKRLKNESDIEKSDVSIVGYFKDDKKLKLFKQYSYISQDEANFYYTTNPVKNLENNDILYNDVFGTTEILKNEKLSYSNLMKFMNKNENKLIKKIHSMNLNDFYQKNDHLIIAFSSNFEGENGNFLKEFNKFSTKLSQETNCNAEKADTCSINSSDEKIGFGYSTGKEVLNLLQSVQLSAFDFPSILILSKKTQKNIIVDKSKFDIFSSESIDKFWQEFKSGNVKSFLKSEEEPENNDKSHLKTITLNNFERIVHSNKKSTMVYFWRNMCPHCTALSPIYEQLSKDFQNSNEIQLGKMNVEKNALPTYVKVDYLPTLLFFPNCNEKEKEKYLEYRGERNFIDIRNFMIKNKCQ
eukprot:gene5873-9701_t